MKATIVKQNGTWCIREGFADSLEPNEIFNYWPIGRTDKGINIEEFEGREVSRTTFSYEYALRLAPYEYARIFLLDGGQTKSIHTDIIPVERPKISKRIELRWKNGQWEKLLKRGWVSA